MERAHAPITISTLLTKPLLRTIVGHGPKMPASSLSLQQSASATSLLLFATKHEGSDLGDNDGLEDLQPFFFPGPSHLSSYSGAVSGIAISKLDMEGGA